MQQSRLFVIQITLAPAIRVEHIARVSKIQSVRIYTNQALYVVRVTQEAWDVHKLSFIFLITLNNLAD